MSNSYRIALCGRSIFLHTIGAALAEDPTVEVLQLPSHLPSIVERIIAWQPDIVLFEHSTWHGESALALLSQGVPLVEIAPAADEGTLLVGQSIPLANLDDLTQLIRSKRFGQVLEKYHGGTQ